MDCIFLPSSVRSTRLLRQMTDLGSYYLFGSLDSEFIPSLIQIKLLLEIILLDFLNNISNNGSIYMTHHPADARAVTGCPVGPFLTQDRTS